MEALQQNILQRIINILLINASFIDNPGLMHGKMGITIFFYHLARKTQNKIYENYAGELLDEIFEEIDPNTPWDFENGLAGIGWGIEYLVQNGFVEADTDKVLAQIDNVLFNHFIYSRYSEPGLMKGAMGIGIYFMTRIRNGNENINKIASLTNRHILIQFIDELDRISDKIIQNGLHKYDGCTLNQIEDFIVLLNLLAILHDEQLYNYKIETLIVKFFSSLNDFSQLPRSYLNRLLLAFTLEKIKSCFKEDLTIENYSSKTGLKSKYLYMKRLQPILDQISNRLTEGFNNSEERIEKIVFQTEDGDFFASSIFRMIFKLNYCENSKVFTEWESWTQITNQSISNEIWFNRNYSNGDLPFGILHGITGIGLQLIL